jgi:DNA polymerase-3 subunit delta
MQIALAQLASDLRERLRPVYLVYGEEPLLIDEALGAIRGAAHAQGFGAREVHTVEAGFDWDALRASSRSLSLFAERRLMELRLPTGKPGETGTALLVDWVAQPPQDTVLIVSCGRLEKVAREAKWFKALAGAAAVIAVYALEASQLPGWIVRRMRAQHLEPGPGVAELLAFHMEGNLLAAAQEIDKLALLHGQADAPAAGRARTPVTVSVEDIEGALSDNARFSVFTLADACLLGQGEQIVRMFAALRAEGVEPVLILWVLVREIRAAAQMAAAIAAGQTEAAALEQQRVWPRRRPLVSRALRRGTVGLWQGLLCRAARADRVVKGRRKGDAWQELECLALALGGVRLGTCA